MALWFERAWIDNGWAKDVRLAVTDGQIASIETGVAAEPGDERHRVGLPGLCNVHSHGFHHAQQNPPSTQRNGSRETTDGGEHVRLDGPGVHDGEGLRGGV